MHAALRRLLSEVNAVGVGCQLMPLAAHSGPVRDRLQVRGVEGLDRGEGLLDQVRGRPCRAGVAEPEPHTLSSSV
jgi:hypothetical protein